MFNLRSELITPLMIFAACNGSVHSEDDTDTAAETDDVFVPASTEDMDLPIETSSVSIEPGVPKEDALNAILLSADESDKLDYFIPENKNVKDKSILEHDKSGFETFFWNLTFFAGSIEFGCVLAWLYNKSEKFVRVNVLLLELNDAWQTKGRVAAENLLRKQIEEINASSYFAKHLVFI